MEENQNVYENVTDQAEEIKPDREMQNTSTNYSEYMNFDPKTGKKINNTGGNMVYSILSLICGIVSILCCCSFIFSLIVGIAAVVFGIITLKNGYDGIGMAIAGIITGGIAVVIILGGMMLWGIGSMLGNVTNKMMFRFNDHVFDNFDKFDTFDQFKVFF